MDMNILERERETNTRLLEIIICPEDFLSSCFTNQLEPIYEIS